MSLKALISSSRFCNHINNSQLLKKHSIPLWKSRIGRISVGKKVYTIATLKKSPRY